MSKNPDRVSMDEIEAEDAVSLPNKEVLSLLDVNANVDLGLDLAAPVDLAAAANLNVAAPIEAAVGANVLSAGSEATSVAQQQVLIDQGLTGDATANAPQTSTLDQGDDAVGGAAPAPAPAPEQPGGTEVQAGDLASGALSGNLLDVNVDLAADVDLAAPIAGAVAANANVAAPIDAAVAANIGSVGSEATAIAQQDAIITQDIAADAHATADQQSTIAQ